MFATLLRVLFGFLLACLVAGFVQAGFAMTPELIDLPEQANFDQTNVLLMRSLFAATQSVIFAAPFALVAAAVSEWQGIRSLFYYVAIALAICAGGVVALYAGELENQPSIVNGYAVTAFAVTGLAAGLIYWMLSGRFAGEPFDDDAMAPVPAAAPPVRVSRPAAAVPPVRANPTPAAPPPSPSTGPVPAKKA